MTPRGRAILTAIVAAASVLAACGPPKNTPQMPAAAASPLAVPTLEIRISWILRLEQQRQLRETRTPAAGASAGFSPAMRPDLELLLRDSDPLLRRRAALAIGRVGMTDAIPALAAALADPDADVRATAAFALGLIGHKDAVKPLVALLKDDSPSVRARAIDALGLIGEAEAAAPIADASQSCGGWLASVGADDDAAAKAPLVEPCRAALFALVRLRQFDQLARVALDPRGSPVSRWWPVAFALQRSADPRAVPALLALADTSDVNTRAFAIKGLAAAKDARVVPIALALLQRADVDVRLRIVAARALGSLGARDAVAPLSALITQPATPLNLLVEAIDAIGAIGDASTFGPLLDLQSHAEPAVRAAGIAAAAKADPEGFLLVLSSLPLDRHWAVRAAFARALGDLRPDRVRGALEELANDQDDRVKTPVLETLARIGAPDLTKRLFDALDAPDFVLRATAARLIGERKPEAGVPPLVRAYSRAESDAAYDARLAALEALAKYAGEDAKSTLRRALADREWPVRGRAAEWLRGLGEPAEPLRPAPIRQPPEFFESDRLLRPAFSPHAYLETRHGTIELELNVVDAPFTTQAFIELARAGFYNGIKVHRLIPHFVIQAGDRRGDGEGGPGFTIRDEFSATPFVRGTVGIATAGRDTGGSQFFITLSPQPHLDGKYTAFARVVKGFELLDDVALWDEIKEVWIWDGVTGK